MRKVLFISHDASRTGAPIVLLDLLKFIKEKNYFEFDVLLINGGVLEQEFKDIAPVFIFNQERRNSILTRIFNKVTRNKFIDHYKNRYLKFIQKQNYSLIYSNTVASAETATFLKNKLNHTPLILHIHELEYAINVLIGHDYFASKISDFGQIIAVCDAVKQNLISNYNVNPEKISTIYEFSNQELRSKSIIKEDIIKEMGLSSDAFVVGSAGGVEWRKGADVFLNLANKFHSAYPLINCVFVWVGRISANHKMQMEFDIQKLSLVDKVLFIGEKTNPTDYFSLFDVFTLVSREDPFPLVCLENAALSKPILCFDRAGGMPEFVNDDAGFIVPYMNLDAMAEKIYVLKQNKDLKQKLGANARQKLHEQYSRVESIEKIITLIRNYL